MKRKAALLLIFLLLFPFSNWALVRLDSLNNVLEQVDSDTAEINVRLELAATLVSSDKTASYIHIQEAIELSRQLQDPAYLGQSFKALAEYNYVVAEYEESLENLLLAEAYFKRANLERAQSGVLNSMGRVYAKTGNFFEALSKFLEAEQILSKIEDDTYLEAVYNNIGVAYFELEYYELAEKYYYKSLSLRERAGDEYPIALSLNNIGEIALKRGDYGKAKSYFLKAVDIQEGLGAIGGLSLEYANLGMTYTNLEEFDSARVYFDKALMVGRDFDDKFGLLNTKNCIAAFHHARGEELTAIDLATECLQESEDLGVLIQQREALSTLYMAHEANGDFEEALKFNLLGNAIKDSIRTGGERFDLLHVEQSFDAEKKILELQQLKEDKENIQKPLWEQKWFVIIIFFVLLSGLITILEVRRSKSSDARSNEYENVDYMRSTRILYITAAVFYPILPTLMPYVTEGLEDPMIIRIITSVAIIVFYFLSFVSFWVRKNIDRVTKMFFVFMTSHHFYLIFINDIPVEHVLNLAIVLSGVTAVFKRLWTMSVFVGFATAIMLLIHFTAQSPHLDPNLFISVTGAILIVSLVVSASRMDLDRHLEFSNEVVNQADALVFIVNRKGENIYTSQSIKNILGIDPQEMTGHDWIEKLGVSRQEANRIKNNLILLAMGTIEPEFNPYQPLYTKDGELKWLSIKEKRIEKDRVLVIGLDVTQHKKIQDELANSERNFRQINETLTDVFYLYNIQEKKCEYVSPNSESVMGAPPEFFYSGKSHVAQFVLDSDKIKVREAVNMVENGIPFDIEYRIKIGDRIKWVREKSYPVRNEEGVIIKNSGLCQDITERKNAEEEIRRLSLVASNTDNFILMVNGENRVEWANQSFYNLTGYTERETLGKLPLELISGRLTSEATIDEISHSVFVEKRQAQYELINYKKDEEIFHSSLEVTPLLDDYGNLEKYFVIGTDVTQRIIDREQIEKLSLVASNTSNYVIIAHADRGIEWVNEAFTDKFGYELEEVLGKLPSQFLHKYEAQPTLVDQINQNVFQRGEKFKGEVVHLTKEGKEIYANVDITPLFNRDNEVEKYFVLGVDITQRKIFEEDIKKANLELSGKERELNESESNFRELIRSIKEVFWLSDRVKNELIFVSDSYKEVFGRPAQSLIDRPDSWSENVHPEDKERVVESFKKNSASGNFNEDYRLVLDNGEEKWVNSRVFPIHDENGKLIRMSGFTEDITDKKEQELKIQKIADQLDVVHSIEQTILTSESTEDIIYNTLSKTIEKLPVLRASLALFNYEDQTFYSYAKMRGDGTTTTDGREFELKEFGLHSTLLEERTNIVRDLREKEIKTKTDEILIGEGAKLVLLSPLFHGETLIGSLNVCFTDAYQEDTDHYETVTNEVANGLAIAIQQSKLKDELHRSNTSITASIDYAKMIQQAYIPDDLSIDGVFSDNMIINRPKDIVSGDFYWVGQYKDIKVLAIGDCTGHGVPGAFMTIIGISELNNIVTHRGVTDPADILNHLNEAIVKALATTTDVQLKDGMDVGIFCFNTKTGKAKFGGARRPLSKLSASGELVTITSTKLSIGDTGDNFGIEFETVDIEASEGDTFYMYSDGCTDQFGGERIRKFSKRRLDELIIGSQGKTLADQKEIIQNALIEWQGPHFQTDDILFVGFKLD